MHATKSPLGAGTTAAIGLASLATAMGLGRFAFTPLLPPMQQAFGITLSQGAWLAAANYIGYLLGAIASLFVEKEAGIKARWGLIAVAGTTLAMGFASTLSLWFVLRFLSGVASAFVLVGAAAWTMGHLAAADRTALAGWVFAGVGTGIIVAGVGTLALTRYDRGPNEIWIVLGILATSIAVAVWEKFAVPSGDRKERSSRSTAIDLGGKILIGCYGAVGLGYIITATFLPTAVRRLIDDPSVFGWAWPIFGLAAALSAVFVSTLLRKATPRRVVVWCQLIMAIGVVAPLVSPSFAGYVVSALCVGSTFMVTTMAGAQEAKRIAPDSPTPLIAALTVAFAVGQLIGPILVGLFHGQDDPFVIPSILAAAALLAGSASLFASSPAAIGPVEPLPKGNQ